MNDEKGLRIRLLGTGAGDANWGLPGSEALPARDVRRYASLFIAPDTLIDFNNHTPEALDTFGIAAAPVRHLLISHGHYDHLQPMEILRFAQKLPEPLRVYGNSMVRDALEFCRDNSFDAASGRYAAQRQPFAIRTEVLRPGATVLAGRSTVTALLANHFMNKPYNIMEQQALNFVLERGGRTLFYGLDSSYLLPGTLSALARFRFDAAILDATFGPLKIDPVGSGHLNWTMLDETISELRKAGCLTGETLIIADHLSTDNVEPYDEIAGRLSEKGITLAYDGMEVQV